MKAKTNHLPALDHLLITSALKFKTEMFFLKNIMQNRFQAELIVYSVSDFDMG